MTGATSAAKFAALALIAVAAALCLAAAPSASPAHFAQVKDRFTRACSALRSSRCSGPTTASLDLSFLAGEVANPQRTLPRAIIGGTLAIVAIYLTTNAAYLYVLPIDAGREVSAHRGRHDGRARRADRRKLRLDRGRDLDVRRRQFRSARRAAHLLCGRRGRPVLQDAWARASNHIERPTCQSSSAHSLELHSC